MTTDYQQTTLYPMVQFRPDTWELDEFDCASIFVLVGDEKAMVIDAGMGIGDLYAAVRQITDKPIELVISHGHVDHIQNAYRFGRCYMNERDMPFFKDDVERRKYDAGLISTRQGGIYAYDMEKDITAWTSTPEVLPLVEGQVFELGNRKITTYGCPGHSPGQMMFWDEKTGCLFVGDALNNNLGVSRTMDPSKEIYVGLEAMLAGFMKMQALRPDGDNIFNGHHDYRPLGIPLDADVLSTAIELTEGMLRGEYDLQTQQNKLFPHRTDTVVRKGNSWLAINPEFLPAKK